MRIISRLDIKGSNLIKGIQLEGLRVIGDPNFYAKKYFDDGADELLLIDCVASLYGRNNLFDIIKKASNEIFIPITVGGGIRSIEDAENLFLNGADKIAINSKAIVNPEIIDRLAKNFGSQAIVSSIQAKKFNNKWLAFYDNGREKSEKDVIDWTKEVQDRGAGEILITSIDKEGTKDGFDMELCELINSICEIPVIYSGGMNSKTDLEKFKDFSECDALAAASILHYNECSIREIKNFAKNISLKVRV
jgi:imidazole glycerol-phosphate synthase subunit HisF